MYGYLLIVGSLYVIKLNVAQSEVSFVLFVSLSVDLFAKLSSTTNS